MTWVAWALLSAFFAGITAILAKVGVERVDSNVATAIRTAVVLRSFASERPKLLKEEYVRGSNGSPAGVALRAHSSTVPFGT